MTEDLDEYKSVQRAHLRTCEGNLAWQAKLRAAEKVGETRAAGKAADEEAGNLAAWQFLGGATERWRPGSNSRGRKRSDARLSPAHACLSPA